MDEFETIAADLEKSIKTDEGAGGPLSAAEQELLKDPANIKKALALGAAALLKAKGAQPTDLSQEKAPKSKTVTETEEDPAEEPVPSGKGYKDTRPYVGKGDDKDDDDADGDDDKPSFFGKKKKPMKKSAVKDTEDSDEVDVTEFVSSMEKSITWLVDQVHELRKSQETLVDGSAVFGQVLHEVAANDPRRDTLFVTMAKSLAYLATEVKDLKKSAQEHRDLVKSIATMPGAPRAAGLALLKAEAEGSDEPATNMPGGKLDNTTRTGLWKAVNNRVIDKDEYRRGLQGDQSIIAKALKV